MYMYALLHSCHISLPKSLANEKRKFLEQIEMIELVENKAIREYRMASEDILTDYTEAVAELHQTKDEKEKLQQMYTKTTQELNQQRERARLLEVQRKKIQNRLSYMDAQVGE